MYMNVKITGKNTKSYSIFINSISRSTSMYILNNKLLKMTYILYHAIFISRQNLSVKKKNPRFNLKYNLIDYTKVRIIIDK